MASSFSSLLNKNKEESSKNPDKKVSIIKPKTDRTIYGSGITKRKAEQAERDIEKLSQRAYEFQETHKKEFGELVNLDLPDTLTDDSIKLDEDQQAAVNGLKNQKYGCLIGQAGVGKTTTVKALINELLPQIPTVDMNLNRIDDHQAVTKDLNVSVCFCSFMGKAVQQIKRALPKEYHPLCQTIHATLGYAPEFVEKINEETGETYSAKVFRPQFHKHNKLNYSLVIVDEAGSVPIYLWNELVEAMPDDCRFILIGDLNQLPPVTGRSVLGFAITKWPTFVLNKIHRQAEDNPIIANADRIIHGKKPIQYDKKFIVKQVPDSAFQAFQHTCGIIQTLHKNGIFDPLRDAFIVPQNKDTIGQIAFNEKLVRYFNPVKKVDDVPINPPLVITAGYHHVTHAVGDKVMITSNDREKGLTNGMIGVVEEIKPNPRFKGEAIADQMLTNLKSDEILDLSNLSDEINNAEKSADEMEESERQASHIMTVKFQNVDEEVVFESAGSYKKVIHAYAMTGHKSQGSEYPVVVVLVHSANHIMLTREWLYTVVTRAQQKVIILTNHRGLTQAVNRQLLKGKTIAEKAEQFTKLSGKEDTTMPILNEPTEV